MQISAGMRAVVVGLGKSGLAAVRYLHGQGVQVVVSEYRDLAELSGSERAVLDRYTAAFETGGHSEKMLTCADVLVVSPGVPPDLPAVGAARSRGIPVLGELALAAGMIPVPVIAVTGSNGKTTVTSLLNQLLQSAGKKVFVGGNIGTPVLEYLIDPDDSEVMVLELSSFQLASAGQFRPDIGLLLNMSPDHLDWHGSMQAYTAAKYKMFAHQTQNDIALLGTDDPLLAVELVQTAGTVDTFGTLSGCRARVDEHSVRLEPGFAADGHAEVYELAATRLSSRVNRYNAAAALLAVRYFGCSSQDVRVGLDVYKPPEHRMTPVARINGVRFVNDSKATNVGAVIAALAGFDTNVVLIAGGRDKGSDFSTLRRAVREHVCHLVLLGEAGADIGRALEGTAVAEYADSMDNAVTRAFAAAAPGDTVLLAPACASFDMFADYGQRGRVFTRCVQQLEKENRKLP